PPARPAAPAPGPCPPSDHGRPDPTTTERPRAPHRPGTPRLAEPAIAHTGRHRERPEAAGTGPRRGPGAARPETPAPNEPAIPHTRRHRTPDPTRSRTAAPGHHAAPDTDRPQTPAPDGPAIPCT